MDQRLARDKKLPLTDLLIAAKDCIGVAVRATGSGTAALDGPVCRSIRFTWRQVRIPSQYL